MQRSLTWWHLGGFLFTSLSGVVLHFLYDWTGQSPLIAPFSAVNESIWEHMKLLYVPLMVFTLIQSRSLAKDHPCFWQAKLWGTLAGLITIPLLYYAYTGALGVSADWFNIFLFFVAAAVAFWLENHLLHHQRPCHQGKGAIGILVGLGVLFAVLTFIPLHLPLFRDPLTGTYGR